MAKHVGRTSTRASDAGSTHRLSNKNGDGTMRSEGAKRGSGTHEQRIGFGPGPAVLQVIGECQDSCRQKL